MADRLALGQHKPKNGQFWIAFVAGENQPVQVWKTDGRFIVYTCGDEQGYDVNDINLQIRFVRKIRL